MKNAHVSRLWGSVVVALSAAVVALAVMGGVVSAQRAPAAGAPTFSKDVAPILYKSCIRCHRPEEIGRASCRERV